MGLLFDTARAVIASLKERSNELTATMLLEETLRVINGHAEPHWHASSASELPSMISELARDRDDFRMMAASYREELAVAEARVRELELALRIVKKGAFCYKHESWCDVHDTCNCSDLDEEDV